MLIASLRKRDLPNSIFTPFCAQGWGFAGRQQTQQHLGHSVSIGVPISFGIGRKTKSESSNFSLQSRHGATRHCQQVSSGENQPRVRARIVRPEKKSPSVKQLWQPRFPHNVDLQGSVSLFPCSMMELVAHPTLTLFQPINACTTSTHHVDSQVPWITAT